MRLTSSGIALTPQGKAQSLCTFSRSSGVTDAALFNLRLASCSRVWRPKCECVYVHVWVSLSPLCISHLLLELISPFCLLFSMHSFPPVLLFYYVIFILFAPRSFGVSQGFSLSVTVQRASHLFSTNFQEKICF